MKQTTVRLRAKYRYSLILLKELVKTDFKLRYQGSFLGYIWSLLKPLFMFVILYLVFGVFFKAGTTIPHYPVYLLLGILLWNYFLEVTMTGVTSIVSKGDLLRKLNFPKYTIVLAGSFSAFINLLINFIVLGVFMVINGVALHWSSLFVAFPLLELFFFSLGVAFLLSSLFVKFRDVSYIWEILTQAGFYLTPILYPITLVITRSHLIAKLMMFNPLAQIIQDMRYLLITHDTITFEQLFHHSWYRLVPIVVTIVFAGLAAWYFRRQSPKFAEEI